MANHLDRLKGIRTSHSHHRLSGAATGRHAQTLADVLKNATWVFSEKTGIASAILTDKQLVELDGTYTMVLANPENQAAHGYTATMQGNWKRLDKDNLHLQYKPVGNGDNKPMLHVTLHNTSQYALEMAGYKILDRKHLDTIPPQPASLQQTWMMVANRRVKITDKDGAAVYTFTLGDNLLPYIDSYLRWVKQTHSDLTLTGNETLDEKLKQLPVSGRDILPPETSHHVTFYKPDRRGDDTKISMDESTFSHCFGQALLDKVKQENQQVGTPKR